jgi:hypothetical protein
MRSTMNASDSSPFFAWPARLMALALAAITACQTTQPFPKPDATWQTRVGQLQYAGAGRSVVGECVVSRRGTNEFQLDFHSGPGFPLLRLWRSGDQVRAEGLLARGSWHGNANRAPERLRGWSKMAADFPAHTGRRVTLTSADSKERFSFVFPE